MKKVILIIIGSLFILLTYFLVQSKQSQKLAPNQSQEKYQTQWDIEKIRSELAKDIVDPEFKKYFDRDPERHVPLEKNIIVAPTDGDIVSITHNKDTLIVRIHISILDVHVQRVPISGEVLSVDNVGSGYLRNSDPDFINNVQTVTTLDAQVGRVVVKQITGRFQNRIQVFVKKGDNVKIGDKLGRILLGSTVIIVLPESVRLEISEGQTVVAGETIIGRY